MQENNLGKPDKYQHEYLYPGIFVKNLSVFWFFISDSVKALTLQVNIHNEFVTKI